MSAVPTYFSYSYGAFTPDIPSVMYVLAPGSIDLISCVRFFIWSGIFVQVVVRRPFTSSPSCHAAMAGLPFSPVTTVLIHASSRSKPHLTSRSNDPVSMTAFIPSAFRAFNFVSVPLIPPSVTGM